MTTLRASAVTASILCAVLCVSGCDSSTETSKVDQPTPSAAPAPEPAATAPSPETVSLPDDFPGDLPAIGNLTRTAVKRQSETSYKVEYVGAIADRTAFRKNFAAGLEERGWELGISASIGEQESILATKGLRSLSFLAEPGDAGARVEISVDRENAS